MKKCSFIRCGSTVSGALVDEPLVIVPAASLYEAAVDYFGNDISFEGAIHQLRGSIALVRPGRRWRRKWFIGSLRVSLAHAKPFLNLLY